MIRINTLDKIFHDATKFNHGTLITADWLNSIQEEVANAIEGLGGTVDGSTSNQLATQIAIRLAEKSNTGHKHILSDIENIYSKMSQEIGFWSGSQTEYNTLDKVAIANGNPNFLFFVQAE